MESTKKIALVTGANRGIGFETARQLARNGFTVLLAARSLQEARTAVAELEKLAVVSAIPVELDITSATDREGISRLISERFGRLDVLVNNALLECQKGTVLSAMPLQAARLWTNSDRYLRPISSRCSC